jgi:hypothetical protein
MKKGTLAFPQTYAQDRVFQLSLTEIAFIIAFLVMFLLGWMIVHIEREKNDALARAEENEDAAALVAAADKAKTYLAALFAEKGAERADQIVSELVAREKLTRERDALRERIGQLEHTVSTLVEAQADRTPTGSSPQQVADALAVAALFRQHLQEQSTAGKGRNRKDNAASPDGIVAAAKSALALKTAVDARLHAELGRTLLQGQEAKLAAELVSAARHMAFAEGKSPAEAFAGENRDLRGQVAFLTSKLEGKGGRDYPPCWAEEGSGRIQYLFAIDITEQGLIVKPAWPEARTLDARALAGMDALTAAQAPLHLRAFKSAMQGIDEHSRKRSCRHYVIMRNHVSDLAVFNTYRFAIEHYFYKLESQ